jgi:glucosylceramidase
MLRLFDPRRDWHQLLRNPIGSSDLTRGWCTYDDNSSDRADASLPHFSIDHDLADVLPLTKLARQLNPQLTLMINAWSPPAWMTSSGSLVAGAVLPENYARHANYHVKTIQAYEPHGLHVNYVSLNNEPTCCPSINYPSILLITSSQMATMLKDYWFPAFKANHLTPKILLLDFNWGKRRFGRTVMTDEAIRTSPFVGALPGTGAAATQPCSRECTTYAEKTNSSPNAQASTVAAASERHHMRDLVNVIRNWGKSFVKGPVAVDEPNGPNRGGCDTCRELVTVHTNNARAGQVDYTIEYSSMGQFTKFVPNGAHRIDCNANSQILNVVFQNPDGSLVLIACNDTTAPQTFKVVWHGQSFSYSLPVNSQHQCDLPVEIG